MRMSSLSRNAGEGAERSEAGEGGAARKVVTAGSSASYARALRRKSTDTERLIAVYPDGRAYMWRQLAPGAH